MLKIGFIGAGKMGLGVVLNLRKAGHDVCVLMRSNRQNEKEVLKAGAAITRDIQDCISGVDVIFMCLPNMAAWREVVAKIESLATSGTFVVDLTSAQPDLTAETAARLDAVDIGFVDAPMLKGPPAARAGTIQLVVGGKPDHVEAVMPLLTAISEAQLKTGGPGTGHALKLINNAVTLTNSAIVYEALALASTLGVDLELAYQAMRESAAGSKRLDAIAPVLISGDHKPSFDVATALKDLELYSEMSRAAGAISFVGSGAKFVYKLGANSGLGDKPVTLLGEMLFGLNAGKIDNIASPGSLSAHAKNSL